MPNNWKTYKLGDIADIQNGYAFKATELVNSGIPVIKIKNIISPNVSIEDVSYYNGELTDNLKKYIIEKGDFLISMTGSTVNVMSSAVGKMGRYRLDDKSLINQRVGKIYLTKLDIASFEYVCQYLNRYEIHYNLALNATGSANQANISPAQIKDIEILLPTLQEQQSIASILSAIDDKIENNLAINKTLEEMAMALYKHWFVDFGPFQEGEFVESELGRIPEGWEVIQFSKIVSKYIDNRGKTPPIEEEGIPLLEVKHISSNLFPDLKVQKYVSENTYNNWFRNHLEEDDIIISTVGTVGLTSLVPTFSKVAIAQNLLGLRFEKNKFPTGFMFYLMKSPYFLNQIENRLVITVQKSIKRSDLDKIPCLIPNQNLINSFNEIATGYIKQIENNLTENQTLTQLRDTLLPKLISGEVRLKEFQES